jgi:hypothetical protein
MQNIRHDQARLLSQHWQDNQRDIGRWVYYW